MVGPLLEKAALTKLGGDEYSLAIIFKILNDKIRDIVFFHFKEYN